MNSSPTSDEKIMAALAHGSILLMFLGPIVPTGIWTLQRTKSKYVRFHALQAMGYQALLFWLWIVMGILFSVLALCLIFPLVIFINKNSGSIAVASFGIEIFLILAIFLSMGLFLLTGIIGAISCFLGRDFRYPLIGKWLERYLSYSADLESQIDEAREDNWVAGVCHATAVLQIWGIVAPLIVWFTQRERSIRLRFQAMQAAIYQGIALAVYIGVMVLYMGSVFGMMFTGFTAANRGGEIQGPAGMFMMVLLGTIMILWLVVLLLMPIYYLLSAFATVRVLQGRPFHYPILGGILEKRMETSRTPEPIS